MSTKGVYLDPDERFWARIQPDAATGCWVWGGSKSGGYGRFMVEGIMLGVHRWSYERFVGSIPAGLDIDHLCRNRGCVNPAHLEPVTRRENLMRAETLAARCASQTHCVNGHPFSPENTFLQRDGPRLKRRCRECSRINTRNSNVRYELEQLRAENARLRAEVVRLGGRP